MKIYKQETVQHVNATVEECWSFFQIKNLQKSHRRMVFKSQILIKINVSGQIIQYKVTPLLNNFIMDD
jgi:hypothetical protein